MERGWGTRMTLDDIKRYKDIAAFFLKYGQGDIVQHLKLEYDSNESSIQQSGQEDSAKQFCDDLQKLGPTFIKLGQILSTQANILPPSYAVELAKLQDKAKQDPIAPEDVKALVESELGVSLKSGFQEFSLTPVAAASISQVHKAILHNGKHVAVKVQRPNIEKIILQDLGLLEKIVHYYMKNSEWAARYNLAELYSNFRHTLLQELDFNKEATNYQVIKKNLKDFHRIIIPAPILDYTTAKVLTMEYIDAVKITSLHELVKMKVIEEGLIEELFQAYLKQIIIDGFFQMDPHPGNIYLTQEGKLALFDMGMVGYLTPELQMQFLGLMMAVSEGRSEDASEYLQRMGKKLEDFDHYKLKENISKLLSPYMQADISEMPIGQLIIKIATISSEAGLIVPSVLSSIGKTLLSLREVGLALKPSFDANAAIRKNTAELFTERLRKNLTQGVFLQSSLGTYELLKDLPSRLSQTLDWLSRNEMEIKYKVVDSESFIDGVEKVANRITSGLIIAALIVGASLLMRIQTPYTLFGYPALALVFFLLAAIGGIVLVCLHWKSDNQ